MIQNNTQSKSKTSEVGFLSIIVEGVFEQFVSFPTLKLKLKEHFRGLKAFPETRGSVCLCRKD